jgi:hypothetical protein
MANDAMADRLLAKLRQLAPYKVKAYDGSDESREIAVPQRRKRWNAVIESIEARPWVRVELLDKQGAILGYVENDGVAGELETIGQDSDRGNRERALLEMMLKAQKVALEYRDKEHTTLLQGMSEMIRANTQAMNQLTSIYQVQVQVAAEVAAAQATAAAGGDMEQWIKLIEASPQLLGTLGPMLRLLKSSPAPAKATPPANGVKS